MCIFQDLNLLATLQSNSKITLWNLNDGKFLYIINNEKCNEENGNNLTS